MFPEILGPSTSPPQEILDQRPWWYLLISFLGLTLFLRMVSFDILGAVLCALMICLCTVILRDGMRELPKFGLMFGLLCGINFVFYAMPVLGAIISGKNEQHIDRLGDTEYGPKYSHTHKLTYQLTVKTSAFFDVHKGLLYNARSAGELLMPIAMLLGTYLGISAHYEFQHHMIENLLDDEEEAIHGASVEAAAALVQTIGQGSLRRSDYGAVANGVMPPTRPETQKSTHKAFQGASHKLSG